MSQPALRRYWVPKSKLFEYLYGDETEPNYPEVYLAADVEQILNSYSELLEHQLLRNHPPDNDCVICVDAKRLLTRLTEGA